MRLLTPQKKSARNLVFQIVPFALMGEELFSIISDLFKLKSFTFSWLFGLIHYWTYFNGAILLTNQLVSCASRFCQIIAAMKSRNSILTSFLPFIACLILLVSCFPFFFINLKKAVSNSSETAPFYFSTTETNRFTSVAFIPRISPKTSLLPQNLSVLIP